MTLKKAKLSHLTPGQKFYFSDRDPKFPFPLGPEFEFMGQAFSEFTQDGTELFRVLLPSVNVPFLVQESQVETL